MESSRNVLRGRHFNSLAVHSEFNRYIFIQVSHHVIFCLEVINEATYVSTFTRTGPNTVPRKLIKHEQRTLDDKYKVYLSAVMKFGLQLSK